MLPTLSRATPNTPAASTHEAPRPTASTAPKPGEFRARLDVRPAPAHPRSSRLHRDGRRGNQAETPTDEIDPWLRRADGSLVLAGALPGLPVAPRGRSTGGNGVSLTGTGTRDARGDDPARRAALSHVQVGRSPGAVHLHARVAEGPHAGVEIRAVERHGRVSIELCAPDGRADALREKLADVRHALTVRGIEGVAVDVRNGDSHGQQGAPRDGEERQPTGVANSSGAVAVDGVATEPARADSASDDVIL